MVVGRSHDHGTQSLKSQPLSKLEQLETKVNTHLSQSLNVLHVFSNCKIWWSNLTLKNIKNKKKKLIICKNDDCENGNTCRKKY